MLSATPWPYVGGGGDNNNDLHRISAFFNRSSKIFARNRINKHDLKLSTRKNDEEDEVERSYLPENVRRFFRSVKTRRKPEVAQ